MITLKCDCKIKDDGTFVVGEHCKASDCEECNMMPKIHPFGNKKLDDIK